jgi:hypothetical protein
MMTCNRVSKSTAQGSLAFIAIALALNALRPAAFAQQPAGKASEPATVQEATRVLDLRAIRLLEGAKVNLRSLGMLTYSAKGGMKEAFAFHQQDLAKRGFKELPGRSSHAHGESSHFTKDGFLIALSTSPTSDPQRMGWSDVTLVNEGNVTLD